MEYTDEGNYDGGCIYSDFGGFDARFDLNFRIEIVGPPTKIRVETAADGSGSVVSAQNVTQGSAITVYAISRDAQDNFVANVTDGTWSLENKTSDVVDGDLVGGGGSAVFTAHKTGTAEIRAAKGGLASTDSGTITVVAGAAATFAVTTQHSGAETAGTAFSVTLTAKDGDGNTATGYTGDHSIVWTWTATNSPDATVPTKPADGNQTFTAGVATISGFTLTNSGETPTITATAGSVNGTSAAITVNDGAATKIRVETAADGSGSVVSAQNVTQGSAITVYAISRDAQDNFVANVTDGTWSLENKTGSVADGDLAGGGGSAVFTGNKTGTAEIRVTKSGLASTDSGAITVVAGTATKVDLTGPSTVNAGAVSTAFTLTSQDGSGNTANVTSDTVFSLSSNSSGTAPFYSNAAGTAVIDQVPISNRTSTATFYYKDSNAGTPTLTAAWNSGGTNLGSDTLPVTVSLAPTTLATSTSIASTFNDFKVTVTKIRMGNSGSGWETIFSGAAELDLINGGTFPGISGVALPAGTYNQIEVTFNNSLPVTGKLSYSGAAYYTTAATFGGSDNVAGNPATDAGSQTVFTFRVSAWGALGENVTQTLDITPITVDASTDYQPTLRFTIRNKFLLKGTAGRVPTYYFELSPPTVSIVPP